MIVHTALFVSVFNLIGSKQNYHTVLIKSRVNFILRNSGGKQIILENGGGAHLSDPPSFYPLKASRASDRGLSQMDTQTEADRRP